MLLACKFSSYNMNNKVIKDKYPSKSNESLKVIENERQGKYRHAESIQRQLPH
jgi:hypothetical protein